MAVCCLLGTVKEAIGCSLIGILKLNCDFRDGGDPAGVHDSQGPPAVGPVLLDGVQRCSPVEEDSGRGCCSAYNSTAVAPEEEGAHPVCGREAVFIF